MRKKIIALGAALAVALGMAGSLPAQAAPAAQAVMVGGQNVAAPVNPITGKAFPTTTKAPSFKPGEADPNAPKVGKVSLDTERKVEVATRKVAPIVSGKAAAKLLVTPTYWYAVGETGVAGSEMYYEADSNFSVNNPWVDTSTNDHSVAEIAVIAERGSGARQTVEFGWGTNPLADGNMQTQLWAGMIINSNWQGYNAGFVSYNGGSPCGTLGSVLVPYDGSGNWTGANGTSRRLQVQYTNSEWWLACGGQWIGYISMSGFPSPSGGAFVAGDRTMFFGEVYSDNTSTCSDMGEDGVSTATTTAGAFFSASHVNSANASLFLHETDAGAYDTAWGPGYPTALNTFRYGGDSYC